VYFFREKQNNNNPIQVRKEKENLGSSTIRFITKSSCFGEGKNQIFSLTLLKKIIFLSIDK